MAKKKWGNIFDWAEKKLNQYPKFLERFHKYLWLGCEVLYFSTMAFFLYLCFVIFTA